MAGLVNAGKDLLLEGLAVGVDFVSLHTGDPGISGSVEVNASPYARKVVDWAAAASGSMSSASPIVFDVPGSTTINHLGYWSASSSGTFYGSRALDTAQTYATPGTYTIAIGNITESIT
jgi:hypothetical protein